MLKTLYVRVIITFIVAVLVGLISALFIAIMMYRDQLAAEVNREAVKYGQAYVDLYEQYGINEADKIIKILEPAESYTYELMNEKGWLKDNVHELFAAYGAIPGSSMANTVLAGEPVASIEFNIWGNAGIMLGTPLTIDNNRYALFMIPQSSNQLIILNKMIVVALILVLAIGGLCIVIAARYLVRPLKEMKQAVEVMASGRFDIQLRSVKRKDELGQLAKSFSVMAKEIGQMDEMRGQFVSSVSHEIQSPLTSIAGFSRMLMLDKVEDAEQKKRYLQIIYNESQRLSRLSDNLLKVAELDSAAPAFEPVTYDLDEQLRQVIVSFEPQWSAKSIEIELDLPHVKINADEDQLSQVWINIIGNAIKFTPDGGCINIDISFDAVDIKVSVSDTGCGFPPDEGYKLFERFYKADKSRNKELGGSGLGLSIAQKIVNLHKGKIGISNREEGGARVDVTLPSRAAKRKALSQPEKST
ncbi:hypothetical protein A7K91_11555 [Paenibacillus oryzae]|uniref:Heme sensor protein HssS n=1 Tax=Paenibacillus oryzae TaxID=1844972 RepID=A0A1A5YF00_9BACL|nr:HAMP domain-containing sensor histidine kinase [Paenibacillus oryzae]OBR64164.1 hypothetical protein A7K91_11555 [Paenibacillus oryzae]